MSQMTDWPSLRAALDAADRSPIESALQRLLASGASTWLPSEHPLSYGPARSGLRRSKSDPPYSAQEVSDLAEYCAVSVYLHTADALSYLGRSIAAYIAGAPDIAIHLLYYSELRSVHAMLAREGIIVLDKNPISITGASTSERLQPLLANAGTHGATWDLFSIWAEKRSSRFLREIVRVGGKSLDDWLAARSVSGSADAILGELVLSWGVDLQNLKDDRSARNTVSYEPSRLHPVPAAEGNIGPAWLTEEIWTLFEPASSASFEAFDLNVLRDVLLALVRASADGGDEPEHLDEREILSLLEALGLESTRSSLASALGNGAKAALLSWATRAADPDNQPAESVVAAIAARAVTLVRLALGAAGSLTRSSGVGDDAVEFWATDLLASRGLDPDAAAGDLWYEIEEALMVVGSLSSTSQAALLANAEDWAPIAQVLSTTERVVRWVQELPS